MCGRDKQRRDGRRAGGAKGNWSDGGNGRAQRTGAALEKTWKGGLRTEGKKGEEEDEPEGKEKEKGMTRGRKGREGCCGGLKGTKGKEMEGKGTGEGEEGFEGKRKNGNVFATSFFTGKYQTLPFPSVTSSSCFL